MKMTKVIPTLVVLLLLAGCAVISRDIREDALPSMPYKALLERADEYAGRTVILGGYILEARNSGGEAELWILQTPLSVGESPDYKDYSEGRFVVTNREYLDPKIFRPDRRVTVAGTIVGVEKNVDGLCPFSCLKIENRELHLWPDSPAYVYPYYGDPFFYPYGYPYYYGYPFWYPGYYGYPHHYWDD